MRVDLTIVALALFAPAWSAAVDAGLHGSDVSFPAPIEARDNSQEGEELWKRKGGGGGGGGRGGGSSGGSRSGGGGSRSGGGSSSGSGSGSGSSSGRTGGSRSGGNSGSSGTAGSARGGARDSSGGSTKTGSGPVPAYGGGRYYGGGAATPYPAGQGNRRGMAAPFLLVGAGLAFWPGLWLAGAHMYPYSHPYRFYNESARENQTKPVLCGCADHQPCSCDGNNDTEYMSSLLGNGSYAALNKSVVNVADYKGNDTILINGTLPNGTTASGGTDDVGTTSDAIRAVAEALGFWPVVAMVLATIFAA